MLRSLGLVFLLWLVAVSPALAQTPRFELTGTVGGAQAPVVLSPPTYIPRTAPSYVESDSNNLLFTGVDSRVFWTKRLSIVAQVSWANDSVATFTFPKPSQPIPPFTAYLAMETVEHRTWMFNVLQSVDLVAEGRLRPWVAGGFAFIGATDRYQSEEISLADPTVRFQSLPQQIDRSGPAVVLAGGIRVYVTKWLFVSGDESWRGFFSDQPLGAFNAMWRLGIGLSF